MAEQGPELPKDEVTPDVGFEKEVIRFDRLPRGRARVRLR